MISTLPESANSSFRVFTPDFFSHSSVHWLKSPSQSVLLALSEFPRLVTRSGRVVFMKAKFFT